MPRYLPGETLEDRRRRRRPEEVVTSPQQFPAEPAPAPEPTPSPGLAAVPRGGVPPDSFEQISSEIDSFVLHQSQDRISAFPQQMIRDAPFTVASLAFSALPTHSVQTLGQGLTAAWPWLMSRESLGGQGGILAAARTRALAIPDPTDRQRALSFLEGLQTLPTDQQETVMASLRSGAGSDDPMLLGLFRSLTDGSDVLRLRARADEVLSGAAHDEAQRLLDQYEGLSPRQQMQFKESLRNRTYPIEYTPAVTAAIRYVFGEFAPQEPDLFERTFMPGGQPLSPVDPMDRAVSGMMSVFAAPFEAGATGLRKGGEFLEQFPGGRQLRDIAEGALWLPSKTLHIMGEAGNSLGQTAARLQGLSPSDPGYDSTVNLVSFTFSWYAIKAVAGTSRAAVTAARQPREVILPEATREMVKGAEKALEGEGPKGVRTPKAEARARLGGPVLGRLMLPIMRMISLPVERWLHFGVGRRLVNAVYRTNRKYGPKAEGALVEGFRGIDPPMARDLASAGTREEIMTALIDRVKIRSAEEVTRLNRHERKLNDEIEAAKARGEHPADLIATRASIQSRLDRIRPQELLWEMPKPSAIRRVMNRTPLTRFERVLAALYDPQSLFGLRKLPKVPFVNIRQQFRLPGLARVFDDMKGDKLYLPGPTAPADALSRNAALLSTGLRRLGVPTTLIRDIQTRMSKARTEPEFYEVLVDDVAKAIDDSPFIAPDMKRAVSNLFHRTREERGKSIVVRDEGGEVFVRDVLKDAETGNPLPSMSAEFVREIPFPDVELMAEATGWFRGRIRGIRRTYRDETGKFAPRRLKEPKQAAKLVAGGAPLLAYNTVKAILSAATMVLKPAVLAFRIPALIFRIQGEQGVRNFLYGYRPIGARFTGRKRIPEEVRPELGSLARQAVDLPEGIRTRRRDFDARDYREPRDWLELPPELLDGLYQDIMAVYRSPEMHELLKRGPQGFVRWLDSDEGRPVKDTFAPIIERAEVPAGVDPWVHWAEGKWESIQQLAGGDPALLKAMMDGAWHRRGWQIDDAVQQGIGDESRVFRYERLREEYRDLDQIIRDEYAKGAPKKEIRAYQDWRKHVRDEIKTLEKESGAPVEGYFYPLDNAQAFKDGLRDAWMAGEYKMPGKVHILERVADVDRVRIAQQARTAITKAMYQPLRTLTIADMAATRGGLFHQIWRERFSQAVARYGKGEARAKLSELNRQAMWRAARETSEMMYDLAARSSAQRFLKNWFWFLPAYQEVLTTWFVKIPQRYGYPAGLVYVAGRPLALLDLFRDEGWIEKNERGEDVVRVPGAAKLFQALNAEYIREDPLNPDVVTFRPSGLNLVAGGLPTIAGGPAGASIAELARKHGGTYKWLADNFLFSMDVSTWPSGVKYLVEAWTGKTPWEPFSNEYQQQIHDGAFDDALAMAYYRLTQNEKDRPPKFKDYPADSRGEQQYTEDMDAWLDRWMAEGKDIYRSRAMVRLWGATVFPVSLRPGDEYRKQWTALLESIIGDRPLAEGFTPHQTERLNQWMSTHPGSVAYRVFRTETTGEKIRDVAFEPDPDEKFFTELYTGEKRYLKPEEFQLKVMRYESFRQFNLQLEQELARIGEDAPTLLRNGYQRMSAIRRIAALREKYEFLNPGAASQWRTQLQRWARAEQQAVPFRTFEMERLGKTINYLQQLEPFFTSGGIRDANYRRVLGQLKGIYAETGIFGAPNTPVEKGFAWFFDNVMGPYMDKVQPLYDKADQLSAAGGDPGPIFTKIRNIANRYGAMDRKGPDGLEYPHPEEVFWGNLTETEQDIRKLHWLSEPTGWLTEFQREKAGIAEDPKYTRMFDVIEEFRTKAEQFREENDVSPTSNYAESLDLWEQKSIRGYVEKEYGEEGLRFWRLSEAPPYKRLEVLDYGAGNDFWKRATRAANQIIREAIEKDLTPSSTSEFMESKRETFFPALDRARQQDPQFNDLMVDLAYALAPSGELYREGPSLYDALFFNQFETRYVPDNPRIYAEIGAGEPPISRVEPRGSGELVKIERPRTRLPGDAPSPENYGSFDIWWTATFENGRIPTQYLTPVRDPSGMQGFLRPDAAASYEAMRKAAVRDGIKLNFTSPVDTYRTYQVQVNAANNPDKEAPVADPGTSIHGWGRAIDFRIDPETHAWIVANAPLYGWRNPYGNSYDATENWHWEYIGAPRTEEEAA